MAVGLALGTAALLIWRFQAWKRIFYRAIESYVQAQLKPIRQRLDDLGRRWTMRARARAEADDIRQELERDGWQLLA